MRRSLSESSNSNPITPSDDITLAIGVLWLGQHALDDFFHAREFSQRFFNRAAALLEQQALVVDLVERPAKMIVRAVAQIVGIEVFLDFAKGQPYLLAIQNDPQAQPIPVGIQALV